MKCVRFLAATLVLAVAGGLAAAPQEDAVPRFPPIVLTPLDGGQSITIEAFAGRAVLVNFWASWCGPCRYELPELDRLGDELAGAGLELLTVNMDRSPEQARRFLASVGIEVPVYRAQPRDLATVGVEKLPTTILLAPDGRPLQIYEGYHPGVAKDIRSRVHALGLPAGRGAAETPAP